MSLMFARIPLMLVEGEDAPSEMKLITVDNGLVRRAGTPLSRAQYRALTKACACRGLLGGASVNSIH